MFNAILKATLPAVALFAGAALTPSPTQAASSTQAVNEPLPVFEERIIDTVLFNTCRFRRSRPLIPR